jgi:apyrase
MLTLSHVTKTYPEIQAEAAPYLCLDLTYLKVLLEGGFKLPPTAQVTLVKQVDYDGQKIEAAWPLGAAINDLASR